MLYEPPSVCPVCGGNFHVKRLGCENCGSVLEGAFAPDRLSRLTPEMRRFVIIFIGSRGNIREMEKIYGISYPTVRARLDEIIAALDTGEDDGYYDANCRGNAGAPGRPNRPGCAGRYSAAVYRARKGEPAKRTQSPAGPNRFFPGWEKGDEPFRDAVYGGHNRRES